VSKGAPVNGKDDTTESLLAFLNELKLVLMALKIMFRNLVEALKLW